MHIHLNVGKVILLLNHENRVLSVKLRGTACGPARVRICDPAGINLPFPAGRGRVRENDSDKAKNHPKVRCLQVKPAGSFSEPKLLVIVIQWLAKNSGKNNLNAY